MNPSTALQTTSSPFARQNLTKLLIYNYLKHNAFNGIRQQKKQT